MNKKRKGYLSVAFSAIATLAKFIAGVASASVFTVLSAFYSCGFGVAKSLCIKGAKETDERRRAHLYFAVAGVAGASAAFYIAGAVKQIVEPSGFGYGLIPAITVAAVAFYDLAAAIIGLVKESKAKDGFGVAMKRINLSGAIAALALTQTALMSVSDGRAPASAGIMGIIAGAVTAIGAVLTLIKGASLLSEIKKEEAAGEESELTELEKD